MSDRLSHLQDFLKWFTSIQQVLWTTRRIGNRDLSGVDPQVVVERGENVLVVYRPRCDRAGQAIR